MNIFFGYITIPQTMHSISGPGPSRMQSAQLKAAIVDFGMSVTVRFQ